MHRISHYRTTIGTRGTRQYTHTHFLLRLQAPKGGASRDPELKYGYDL